MLRHLAIRNILLLKQCDIEFTAGLNALTGETGAGKSILLDALGLVLGERSDAGLLRPGTEQAMVTAEFEITQHEAVQALLGELDLAAQDTLTVRRSLAADGKSRAFINDAPVNVGTLKRFGELLVERHGQHDQRGLLDSKTHRQLIDAYAGNAALLAKSAEAFGQWKQAQRALSELEQAAQSVQQEAAWLRMMQDELGRLDPQEGEEEALVEQRQRANAVKQSQTHLRDALAPLHAHGGMALALRQSVRSLQKSAGEVTPIIEALEQAEAEIEEASVALERMMDASELDPAAMERGDDRLHALRGAARKYNVAVASLPSLLAEARGKLARITNFDAQQKELSAALANHKAAYETISTRLSAARKKAAAGLIKAVSKELAALKMGATQLRVEQLTLPEAQWGEAGNEQVMFEVATNAGQAFGPLAKVASGGELSRLLLAMKVVLRDNAAATAIFDEIDSGTGGAIAESIGLRLRQLAADAQVIVVTHLPQVAAQAQHHLFIAKSGGKAAETQVRPLDDAARREELARMLSGAAVSDEARQAAQKLLQAAS